MNAKAVMPVFEQHVNELANMPPGPDANTKAKAIIDMGLAILTALDKASLIPNSWKGYTAAACVILTVMSGGALVGRWTAPTAPPAETRTADPIVAPSPIVLPQNRAVVYRTTETPQTETDKLPVGSVDPKKYAPGSRYTQGKWDVPLPCVAIVAPNGAVLDVQPFTTAEAVEKMLKK